MKKNHPDRNFSKDTQSYISFAGVDPQAIINKYNNKLDYNKQFVYHKNKDSIVRAGDTTHTSTRSPYFPGTYENSRPFDALPLSFREIIYTCRSVYMTTGTVRNVIDLLTDFACEGIDIIHPSKKDEAFFKVWWKRTKMDECISEFVKHLFIDGNTVVKRSTATLTLPVESQWEEERKLEESSFAKPDTKLYKQNTSVNKREIPIKYSFINVAALEWIDDQIDKIKKPKKLAFKLGSTVLKQIRGGDNNFLKQFSSHIEKQDLEALKKSGNLIIDMDKVYVCSIKKDSWQDWALPYLYSILSDIRYKEKLRQAEISTLDGLINVIRIWKLGDHKEKILPADGAIDRLTSILENNPGGGSVDIIWDSMIEMQEFYPPVKEILGPEKYNQVDKDILIGLGIPNVLLGGEGANFSNSFIQLKTITERLKYVRSQILNWLNHEISLVCKAMDIKVLPKIKIRSMNLEDENITKKLVLDLLDRGIVSVESVLNIYGEDFSIEVERLKEQNKIFKQAGIEIKNPFDKKESETGNSPGRPVKRKDTSTRDQRTAKPKRSAASLIPIAMKKVGLIDDIVTSIYLQSTGIKNARKLSDIQKNEINDLRALVISNISINEEISEDRILAVLDKPTNKFAFYNYLNQAKKDFVVNNSIEPTFDQLKNIEAICWVSLEPENKNENNG